MEPHTSEAPVIVIFGITGDLSKRKLLPALYHLFREGRLDPDSKIIGTSRHDLSKEDLINTVELCVLETDKVCDPEGLKKINSALSTIKLDPESDEDYEGLKKLMDSFDGAYQRQRLYYMSVPSKAYQPIVRQLASHGLNDSRTKLLLEKPFGIDYDSASKLITEIDQSFDEKQIYRIDHYLAKETALNLLAFRMHNPIFTPIWNCEHIEAVRIRALETIGIEGRVNFYEQTGALRDIVQSHLMQLLSITLMDLPEDMTSGSIHKAKQRFFEGLNEADPSEAYRAQYEGYKSEVGNPDSYVETYVKLNLRSSEEKWKGTLITLETGKALSKKTTDVTIWFKTPHERRRNSLSFQIQPNEGISLDLVMKEPGLNDRMKHEAMDFRYANAFKDYEYVDAYERVLMDAIRNDQSLFASDRDVLETWRVLQPVVDAWKTGGDNLKIYTAGSKVPLL